MKKITLFISSAILIASVYALVKIISSTAGINDLIFMTLLILIVLICLVVSILILYQLINNKKKNRTLNYNSYSDRRIKNQEFEKFFTWIHD
ncbi:hypothetical protein [Flavobacterium sp.]|uniref:hypothetical protein n=1 Tax=Flavobacterium sp. TaxID=239 RepID=UPI003751838A